MASDFLAACEKKNLALTERRMTPARRVSLATEIGERQGELRAVPSGMWLELARRNLR
jgi:hypothetical protein